MTIETCLYKSVCSADCNNACIRFAEMNALLESSGVPEKRWFPKPLSPDDCDYDIFCDLMSIKNDIARFVEDGQCLYLYSKNTGNGKTSWAIKMLLKYFDQVWAGNGFRPRGLFIHTPTFLLKLKDFDNKDVSFEAVKKLIPTVDLVVWDDIGSTGMSAYDNSQLLMYIDQRANEGKSNIYTGNIVGADLEKAIGIRLASRVENCSQVFEFRGTDKRGQ